MRDALLNHIFENNPTQQKKITAFLTEKNVHPILDAFLNRYEVFMKAKNISVRDLGDAYLRMIEDMCYARIEFVRSGHYPNSMQDEANAHLYSDEKAMISYMLGLGLSQFLWRQHFALFQFYKSEIRKLKFTPQDHLLEVGCGHGLFLAEMLQIIPRETKIDAVDISIGSLKLSQDIIQTLLTPHIPQIHFIHSDILKYSSAKPYEFITMGEVLEHVKDPRTVLKKLKSLLSTTGHAYISTCANCPAVDHIYEFHNVDEIRELIQSEGFSIVSEIEEPAENWPREKLISKKVDILYGAIVKKA